MRTPWWATRVGRATLVFGATLLGLVAAGFVGMRYVPALAFARQEVPVVTRPDPSWDMVLFGGRSHLDHTILWNAIGPAIENARRADVLFVGNSQLQFALPPHELRKFERRTGVSVFSLALPFAETYEFPLALIEKFDLRPRVVVANTPGFFKEDASAAGRHVRFMGRWGGLTTVWDEHLAALVWPPASRILPSFVTRRLPSTLLRSSVDGTWMPVRWPTHHAAPVLTEPTPLKWSTRSAGRFQIGLAARRIQLVLTCVPSSLVACPPVALLPLAASLLVPIVTAQVDDLLWTNDLVHLCPLSGKRFGRALLRDLGRLPAIRAIGRTRRPVEPAAVDRLRLERGGGAV